MDIKWIEDFLALVEEGSFTRAAERRHVTQPAFSRRIKSLENWLGVELVDRSVYPTQLTTAGQEFVEPLQENLRQLYSLRNAIRVRAKTEQMLTLSTQHTLSSAFFPRWFNERKGENPGIGVRLQASNFHDCIDYFMAGHSDFLLCYHAPDMCSALDNPALEALDVGQEPLIPVVSPALLNAQQCLVLPPGPIPQVSYPADSFFARLLTQYIYPQLDAELELSAETALTEAMKSMVLQGMGMAWLPRSLIRNELDSGALLQITALPEMTMGVRLYRFINAPSALAQQFWSQLVAPVQE